jgi:hypothetical protein
MSIDISLSKKFPDTGRIFTLNGYPSVIPADQKFRAVTASQAAKSESPAARHFVRSFGDADSTKSIVQEVRLNGALLTDGKKVDIVGIILKEGISWSKPVEEAAVQILERRLSHGSGITLSTSLKQDFSTARLEQVRGVLWANTPIEVEMHNGNKAEQAISIPDNGLDKKSNIITVVMTEACIGSGDACSALSLAATQAKIRAAMTTYFGANTKFNVG